MRWIVESEDLVSNKEYSSGYSYFALPYSSIIGKHYEESRSMLILLEASSIGRSGWYFLVSGIVEELNV